MRTSYLTNTLLALLLCSSAVAGMKDHRMAVSVDPIKWTAGNIDLQYEISMNDHFSFNAPIRFGFDKAVFTNTYFAGGYFEPKFGVKYYVAGKAAEQGFYVNPLVGLFVGKATAAADATAGLKYDFRFGYAWNIWNGVWMDAYLSFQGLATKFNGATSMAAPVPGITPVNAISGGFMLGYVW